MEPTTFDSEKLCHDMEILNRVRSADQVTLTVTVEAHYFFFLVAAFFSTGLGATCFITGSDF
jgi:hypothetical protein